MQRPNALRWDGGPGHYEVWYLSLTAASGNEGGSPAAPGEQRRAVAASGNEGGSPAAPGEQRRAVDPVTGTGLWIRYTLRAPSDGATGECALWVMAMQRDGYRLGRKLTLPIAGLHARNDPFHLTLGEADLSDRGMAGGFGDVSWELSWQPSKPAPDHVHPLLRRARVAKTVLELPHPDLAVSGTVRLGDRELQLDGARGGLAHLWGTKHAGRWAWAHANDLAGLDGSPRPGAYLDGVSVIVPRFGRDVGPSTPIVGHLLGEPFAATAPHRVLRAPSRFALTSWHFEAVDGKRRVVGEVDAPRPSLVGVVYHDPDGERVWCYNSEVASMRAVVFDRSARGRFGWTLRDTLVADGRAHFEYAQRSPVGDVEVLVGG